MKRVLVFTMMVFVLSVISGRLIMSSEEQIKGSLTFKNNVVCFVEGPAIFWQSIKKKEEDYIISLPDEEMQIKIDDEMKVPIITGKKRKRDKNELDENVSETKKSKQEMGMNEEDDYQVSLQLGQSIFLGDTAKVKFTYDKILKLVSKKEDRQRSVLRSLWQNSKLVSVAISDHAMKYRRTEDKGKIFLEESVKEIDLLDTFLRYRSKEQKEKFIMGLDIINHIMLIEKLRMYGLIKQYGFNDFDLTEKLLEKKTNNLLQQAVNLPISDWENSLGWFKEVCESSQVRYTMDSILKRVIGPIPKVLSSWHATDKAQRIITCHVETSWAGIKYESGRVELRNLQDGRVLDRIDDIRFLSFDLIGARVVVEYKNGKKEIIDLKNEKTLLKSDNIKLVHLNAAEAKDIIIYKDDRGEIINSINGKIIFKISNIDKIDLDKTGTKAIMEYKNGAIEIVDLSNRRVLFKGNNINSIYLNAIWCAVGYKNGRGEVISFAKERGEVIFEGNDISWINLNEAASRITVWYLDRGEVRSFNGKEKNGKVILQEDNVSWISLDETGTFALVEYRDCRAKIIDLNSGNIVFEDAGVHYILNLGNRKYEIVYKDYDKKKVIVLEKNGKKKILLEKNGIEKFSFDSMNKLVTIKYKNGLGEIINLEENDEYRRIILRKNNVFGIHLNLNGSKAIVWYKNNKVEVVDLEGYSRDIVFAKLKPEQVILIFALKNFNSSNPNLNEYCRIWNSFDSDLKNKLKEAYVSQEVVKAFEAIG